MLDVKNSAGNIQKPCVLDACSVDHFHFVIVVMYLWPIKLIDIYHIFSIDAVWDLYPAHDTHVSMQVLQPLFYYVFTWNTILITLSCFVSSTH